MVAISQLGLEAYTLLSLALSHCTILGSINWQSCVSKNRTILHFQVP